MSRSSFASFHLTGIKPSSGKMMTSSVDRLFESDSDVFLSNNFNEFQVCRTLSNESSLIASSQSLVATASSANILRS